MINIKIYNPNYNVFYAEIYLDDRKIMKSDRRSWNEVMTWVEVNVTNGANRINGLKRPIQGPFINVGAIINKL